MPICWKPLNLSFHAKIQYEWANSKARNNPLKACAFQMLWEAIAVALSAGFACFSQWKQARDPRVVIGLFWCGMCRVL
jgi:hypothetical protein